jgi:hypothetical protein
MVFLAKNGGRVRKRWRENGKRTVNRKKENWQTYEWSRRNQLIAVEECEEIKRG